MDTTYIFHDVAIDVIAELTREWLDCTIDDVMPYGWPLGDKVKITIKHDLSDPDKERLKDAIHRHFDGVDRTPILPLADIAIERTPSYERTIVTMTCDPLRAGELSDLRVLLRGN